MMERDEARGRRALVRGLLGVSGAALLASLLVTAALVVDHRLSPKHLLTVEPEVLYRSASLPPEQLGEVMEEYGIRTVVNLRSTLENERGDWHDRQAELLSSNQVDLIDLPMHTGYPPDGATLDAWLAIMADPSHHPVLVHCEYGVVRTGMMVAAYQMEQGSLSNQQAMEALELFGGEMKGPVRERVTEFLVEYVPRTPRE
jgi:protein tyrosine/serine phosphatase